MGQPNPSPLQPTPLLAGLETTATMTAPCSASACPFRSEWLMAFVARSSCCCSCCSCCCCLVRVQAYTQHTLFLALSMLFCIFLFALHHQTLPESCVINLPIYMYIAYSIYTRTNCMLYIYNFFHSCLSFCVMRFALLRFWPSRFVAVRVSRVIKKQPPQPPRRASASY